MDDDDKCESARQCRTRMRVRIFTFKLRYDGRLASSSALLDKKMALRVLRASSLKISLQSSRCLSTSLPRHRAPFLHRTIQPTTTTTTTDTIVHDDDTDNDSSSSSSDGGPPTSVIFPRHNTTNTNPLRLTSTLSKFLKVLHYNIHVTCTRNNTHIVICNERGQPIKNGRWSGGSCGFKGVNRSGYEAGYQCAVRAFARLRQLVQEGEAPGARFEVRFSGFGQGREAVANALMTSEGDDVRPFMFRVTDQTPIKIGGTRARKMRRL
jgi:small subunit ribosomal protein S11